MKNLTIILFLLFIPFLGLAQGPSGQKKDKLSREEIEAQKIAFISTQLQLTTEEAEKFWPVYNEYSAKIIAIHHERRSYMKEMKKGKNVSDERAYELTELIFQTHCTESEIRLIYLEKFSAILGKGKAAKVFMAEEQFKRVLLKRLKGDGKHDGPPR